MEIMKPCMRMHSPDQVSAGWRQGGATHRRDTRGADAGEQAVGGTTQPGPRAERPGETAAAAPASEQGAGDVSGDETGREPVSSPERVA